MIHLSEFDDFKKINTLFLREHEKMVKKFNIDFIFLKGVKMPLICLYNLVDILFKKNSKNFSSTDIILLTLVATAILSKENSEKIGILTDELTKRKIIGYVNIIKNLITSLKNLSNIILKKEGLVVTNIEKFLKYKTSVQILSIIITFIQSHNISIKDFAYWYVVDQRSKESNDLINYINLNYYV